MTAPQYYLPEHVFACLTLRHWVFLDVKRDQYFVLDEDGARHFEAIFQGRLEREPLSVTEQEAIIRTADELVSQEILSRSAANTRALNRNNPILSPTTSLKSDGHDSTKFGLLKLLPAFSIACITAHRQLKYRPLAETVERVRRRRKAIHPKETEAVPDVAQLVKSFRTLRLLFPRSYLCLFDSLALLEFLSIFRIMPNWVFGVVAEPFQAHCWLQSNDVVLNDTIERVSVYTPIMVV